MNNHLVIAYAGVSLLSFYSYTPWW